MESAHDEVGRADGGFLNEVHNQVNEDADSVRAIIDEDSANICSDDVTGCKRKRDYQGEGKDITEKLVDDEVERSSNEVPAEQEKVVFRNEGSEKPISDSEANYYAYSTGSFGPNHSDNLIGTNGSQNDAVASFSVQQDETHSFEKAISVDEKCSSSSSNIQAGTSHIVVEEDGLSDQEKWCLKNEVSFDVVTNDRSEEACEKLVALKNIFSRQLPKMPKEYIVRLVFDHRHYSLAIKRQGRIIGGVCYRPFYPQRFGEIAFLAINSTEQVKGFGSILMNQLKHVVQKDRIEYFLTYADNFAIGYFQKQGFSKTIAMPKDRWVGYIKDYDGGTLMECYIHPAVDYCNISSIITQQRAYIQRLIADYRICSNVQSGLGLFRRGDKILNLTNVQGVTEAGWTTFYLYRGITERDRNAGQSKLTTHLKALLDKISSSPAATHIMSERPIGQRVASFNDIAAYLSQGDYYRCKEAMEMDLIRLAADIESRYPNNSQTYQAAFQLRNTVSSFSSATESQQ